MKNIVWLASYPKSGNTWFRIFLTNLLQDRDEPADINHLESTPIASSRNIVDEAIGIDSEYLTHDEIDALRPEVYKSISEESNGNFYMKIHDAFTYLSDGRPLFPPEAARCALYFIRNPLDVTLSFANHSNICIRKSITQMSKNGFSFCSNTHTINNQLRQQLLTWSGHVESWISQKKIPIHVMRYEDMKNNPLEIFYNAIQFAGIDKTREQVKKALELSEFNRIKEQEEEIGFREKAPKCRSFFNKGESGYWKSHLTEYQVKRIVKKHAVVMTQFGYLDENGNPV